jgi:hypothetical protein
LKEYFISAGKPIFLFLGQFYSILTLAEPKGEMDGLWITSESDSKVIFEGHEINVLSEP